MATKKPVPATSAIKSKLAPRTKRKAASSAPPRRGERVAFPKHSLPRALRIASAILEQNAGKPCTRDEAAKILGLRSAAGAFGVEIASGVKYGLLEQPQPSQIQPSAIARKILRPQSSSDPLEGYREAILLAPVVSDVYQHYRGENIPDDQFFQNALAEKYKVPAESFAEFKQVFIESLEAAQLLSPHGDKTRVIDFSSTTLPAGATTERMKKLERTVSVSSSDSCFVMQPFAAPLGGYYDLIYRPAIEKAGLRPVRADADIFATGKIMDQVWSGINAARVLVAELTTRNPNVYYELGLAHALKKPVVLVSAKEEDVPFDLQHIRVIYYDTADPFWGAKLIEKVAENILSAVKNPEEAIFRNSIAALG
ncbi:hypothetical protein SNE35_19340 [Paucibacter sp. R3-3]|uniref:Uncharacterized protein n=1 Tax=Roseateles agri TaxID=3098619 RepID=A0ABU5DK56_9BURK|nr:hypothetical protein [Paucibacter sp. R3-3]MDY0746676.1 hypothetical protein [Paucibacter sp. R3-3]